MASFRVRNQSRQVQSVHLPGRGPVDVQPGQEARIEGDAHAAHAQHAHVGAVLAEPGQEVSPDVHLVFLPDEEPALGEDASLYHREEPTEEIEVGSEPDESDDGEGESNDDGEEEDDDKDEDVGDDQKPGSGRSPRRRRRA